MTLDSQHPFSSEITVDSVAAAPDPKTKLAAPPHFVVYSSNWTPFDASKVKGFNVVALSFLLRSGPRGQAEQWEKLSDADRQRIKASYTAAGIKAIISVFGSTDLPTGSDPVQTANTMAAWVKKYGLDGIDVDYEDLDVFRSDTGRAVNWLIAFTKQLRTQLPVEQYILTHAPIAPWFSKSYSGGGYFAVHAAVGSLINWYNVQFYNQESEYTSVDGLLNKSGSVFPGTSLFEIHANGVALDKLVVGKPATPADAFGGKGFMPAETLAQAVAQAAKKGWNGGVMVWQFPTGDAAWIKTVRGSTFPG